jgi:hypothetical protein
VLYNLLHSAGARKKKKAWYKTITRQCHATSHGKTRGKKNAAVVHGVRKGRKRFKEKNTSASSLDSAGFLDSKQEKTTNLDPMMDHRKSEKKKAVCCLMKTLTSRFLVCGGARGQAAGPDRSAYKSRQKHYHPQD